MVMPPLKDPIATLVQETIDKRFDELAARWLPTLKQADEVLYQVRRNDGVWETRTPQDAVELNGKGREMQLVMRWKGDKQ